MDFQTLTEEIEFLEKLFNKNFGLLKILLGKTAEGHDAPAFIYKEIGWPSDKDGFDMLNKGCSIIEEFVNGSIDSRGKLNLGPITILNKRRQPLLGCNHFDDKSVTFTLGFKSFRSGEAVLSHSLSCRESQRQVHLLRQNIIKVTMCIDKMKNNHPVIFNILSALFRSIPFSVSCSDVWKTSMPSRTCYLKKLISVPYHPENTSQRRTENLDAIRVQQESSLTDLFWSDKFWNCGPSKNVEPYAHSDCRSLSFHFVFDRPKPELVSEEVDESEAATVNKKRERLASVRSSKKQKQSNYCNVTQRGNSFMGRITFRNFQGKKCEPKRSFASEERAALFVDILKFCKGSVPVNFPEEFEMVSAANSDVIELRNRFREADESSDFRAFVDDCRVATETFVFASEEAASMQASNESDSESSDSESWVSDESSSSSEEDQEISSPTDKTASSDDLMSISSSEFGSSVVYVIRARLFKTSLRETDVCGHMDVCYVGLSTENSKRIRDARQGKHPSFNKCLPSGWVFHCDDNYSVEIVDTMGENEVGWNEFKVFMQLVHDTNEGARFVRGSAFCQKPFGEFHPMPSFEILYRAIGNLHYNGPRSGMKFS